MPAPSLGKRMALRLRIRHLELISAVYDSSSILKASSLLNLSQPAVTKALKEVETTLGVELFERSSRGVHPNEYGEALARQAKLILSSLRQVGDEIEEMATGRRGHVYAGTLLSASMTLLPSAIVALKAQTPQVAVTVIDGPHEKLLPSLTMGDLDFVVGRLIDNPGLQGLTQTHLFDDRISLIARTQHPLAQAAQLSLKDLVDQPWILPLAGTALRGQVEAAFESEGLAPPVNFVESISLLTNRAILLQSDSIGVMPYEIFRHDIAEGLVVVLPVKLSTVPSPVGIITRAGSTPSPPAARLIEHIATIAAQSRH